MYAGIRRVDSVLDQLEDFLQSKRHLRAAARLQVLKDLFPSLSNYERAVLFGAIVDVIEQ